jgi:septum formation protein
MLTGFAARQARRRSMALHDSITLASASPRRQELLRQLGIEHGVRPADLDESRLPGEPPAAYVSRLAAAKAEAVYAADPSRPVLAADTAVVLGAELFGKPADQIDGIRMLEALSGRTHSVLTAVAVRHAAGLEAALSVTEVTFRTLAAHESRRYVATGEPLGKAGGYAVQGLAAAFITRLAGSYTGVMGLPLAETATLLSAAGVRLWNTEDRA